MDQAFYSFSQKKTPARDGQVGSGRVFDLAGSEAPLAAVALLGNESFRYVREIIGADDAVLEFVVVINEVEINGVDLIHWNSDGMIDDFKVMIRPLKAVNTVHQLMAEKQLSMK